MSILREIVIKNEKLHNNKNTASPDEHLKDKKNV